MISKNIEALSESPRSDFLAASELLLKYADNILRNPIDPKFRKIRVSNKQIETLLLPVPGAMECLFEMGFQEADSEHLSLPLDASLADLRRVRIELAECRQRILSQQSLPFVPTSARNIQGATSTGGIASGGAADGLSSATRRSTSNPRVSQEMLLSERSFAEKVESSFNHVLVYDNPRLKAKALSLIPREDFSQRAEAKRVELGLGTSYLADLFLAELLAWFKVFFTWTDCLLCASCGGKTTNVGSLQPQLEEIAYGATRVENHLCSTCGVSNRFPRYNDPGKLLDTRTGRCGEWANCFTLCCVAVDFEARHVVDWTDHVWTEVYSINQGRWLHCDPCENALDRPLLYERGWNKKLTYVIAFSRDDLQDVTWRYSTNHRVTLTRRSQCREQWLVRLIQKLRLERQRGLTTERRQVLLERNMAELLELLTEKTGPENGEGLGGRTTGSVEWRLARGELGSGATVKAHQPFVPYTITPTENELCHGLIDIRYSCIRDEYSRRDAADNNAPPTITSGWASFTHEATNLERKVESDWKMVYIAREPNNNAPKAAIGWKIDLSGSDYVIDWVQIRVDSTCFSNGRITWTLCTDTECVLLTPGKLERIKSVSGESSLHVGAELSRGTGNDAWQHTQLFRQELADVAGEPFRLEVHLKRRPNT